MIFLTVGTQLPFDRLVRGVDAWCASRGTGGEVFGQIGVLGRDNDRPTHFDYVQTLPPEDFDARVAAADAIIAHAGMGAIISALSAGTPIAILPRRADLREQRNGHQQATAARFAGRPGLFAAMSGEELPGMLDRLRDAPAAAGPLIAPHADEPLIDALRAVIRG